MRLNYFTDTLRDLIGSLMQRRRLAVILKSKLHIYFKFSHMFTSFLHLVELQKLGLGVFNIRDQIPLVSQVSIVLAIENLTFQQIPIQQTDELDSDYIKRLEDYHVLFLTNASRTELTNHNSSSDNRFRQEISRDPLLKNLQAYQGAENADLFPNTRLSPASVSVTLRTRLYEFTPIGTLIYFISYIVASCTSCRAYINGKADESGSTMVPSVFLEALNSTRISNCGNWRITPAFVGFPQFYINTLGLENTLFDFSWLVTQAGIDMLFAFFARLYSYEGCYVKMVPFKKPVQLESGETTTICAFTNSESSSVAPYVKESKYISTIENIDGSTTKVEKSITSTVPVFDLNLIPGHAYGTSPNGVHALDSVLLVRIAFYNGIGLSPNGNMMPIQYRFSGNESLYIEKRVTVLENSVRKEKVKSSDGDDSSNGDNQGDDKPTGQSPYKPKGTSSTRGSRNKPQAFDKVKNQLLKDGFLTFSQVKELFQMLIKALGNSRRRARNTSLANQFGGI